MHLAQRGVGRGDSVVVDPVSGLFQRSAHIAHDGGAKAVEIGEPKGR